MKALHEMGSSVVVGIVANKVIAILMLAFASSTLFRLYYFRIYLLIILIGAFNGLFLLPILLSWIGPPAVSKFQTNDSQRPYKSNLCAGQDTCAGKEKLSNAI